MSGPAERVMRRSWSREPDGPGAESGKYGLVAIALAAATLTVVLAIAAKLAALPVGAIG
jgi:hypothetical protein